MLSKADILGVWHDDVITNSNKSHTAALLNNLPVARRHAQSTDGHKRKHTHIHTKQLIEIRSELISVIVQFNTVNRPASLAL